MTGCYYPQGHWKLWSFDNLQGSECIKWTVPENSNIFETYWNTNIFSFKSHRTSKLVRIDTYDGLLLPTRSLDPLIFWSYSLQGSENFKGIVPQNSNVFKNNWNTIISSLPKVVWQLNLLGWTLMASCNHAHSHLISWSFEHVTKLKT